MQCIFFSAQLGDDNRCQQDYDMKCDLEQGDCDVNEDCHHGLVCGRDNCEGEEYDSTDDCCQIGNLCLSYMTLILSAFVMISVNTSYQ